jgi:hypothetical protein
MITGKGKIELFRPDTGEVVFVSESNNVVMDQAIRGLAGEDLGGITWPSSPASQGAWIIGVGTGYVNPPEKFNLKIFDKFLAASNYTRTFYARPAPNSFTVSAEFFPEELLTDLGGGVTGPALLTEAGLLVGGVQTNLWNRLLFKKQPALGDGLYQYYARTKFTGIGSNFSNASTPILNVNIASGGLGGAARLDWTHNGSATEYYIFRIRPDGVKEVTSVPNLRSFFIDTGNDNVSYTVVGSGPGQFNEASLSIDGTLTPPAFIDNLSRDVYTLQPYPILKTADFGCRISITITFTLPPGDPGPVPGP